MQGLVNKPLEGLSCIDQAKGHAGKLEKPERSDDSCLGDVL